VVGVRGGAFGRREAGLDHAHGPQRRDRFRNILAGAQQEGPTSAQSIVRLAS